MDATTGGVLGSFQPKLDGSVEALEVGPPGSNTLYVGGTFTSVNGSLQNGLAVLDATTGALRTDVNQQSLTNSGAPGSVWALRLVGTKLYVGGNFTTVDTCGAFDCNRGQAARFDIGTMNLDSWQIYVQGGKVQAFAVDPSRPDTVYVGGQFSGASSSPCGGICDGTYGFLAAFNSTTGALWPAWHPTPPNPDPSHPQEVRDLEAWAGVVYDAEGGGGGRFNVINGDITKTQVYKIFNTDGDVQTLGLSADRSSVFVGGHFTKIVNPASPDNSRCQMFSISTTGPSYSIRPQPNISNGGHYGPFAVIADNPLDTWWGGQLTTLASGYLPAYNPANPLSIPGPATCGTGDQKNKPGDPLSGGGVAHIRDNPHFVDTTPPAAPTGVVASLGIFNGMTLGGRRRATPRSPPTTSGRRVPGSASPIRWSPPSSPTPPRSRYHRRSCSRPRPTSSRSAPSTSVTTNDARARSRPPPARELRSCPAPCEASGSSPRSRRRCGSSTPAAASGDRAPRRSPGAFRSRSRSRGRRPAPSPRPGRSS